MAFGILDTYKAWTIVVGVGMISLGAAPAMADSEASDPMTHPINCATAEGDIRALKAEKKHAQDQIVRNVASITPAGALLGLITGTEGKRLQMLTGEYEKKIDARIAETESQCNIQPTDESTD
ncbi:hypothetical protein ROA7450_01374 [Roseovarius albus]|uniref:Uncharacterized protein n=1 Tax=Roseovarius albus TaxID=1247867 RepID=A0A1X6YW10_9RHOB|nr:hypothetical protein [Roseovarius albus]SLN31090.1 hypothetical protein ROA7450_01374 [Roseovarius albus]